MNIATVQVLCLERNALLRRRVPWIVGVTIGYNLVEVLSAAAIVWQFSRKDPEQYEKATLRVIAFFALAASVAVTVALSPVWSGSSTAFPGSSSRR